MYLRKISSMLNPVFFSSSFRAEYCNASSPFSSNSSMDLHSLAFLLTSILRLCLGDENFLTVLTKATTNVKPAYARGRVRIQGKELWPTLGPGIAWVTEPVNSTRSSAFS
uniref:Uncharacterized protein n=1 Tax=Rhizophora mucronata TaxID=61149 RepID=A0A2P2K127_RHIMU